MQVRLLAGKGKLARWDKTCPTILFRPGQDYFVKDDAWSPAQKDEFLGPLNGEGKRTGGIFMVVPDPDPAPSKSDEEE